MPHSAENQDLINDALDRLGVEPLGKKQLLIGLKQRITFPFKKVESNWILIRTN